VCWGKEGFFLFSKSHTCSQIGPLSRNTGDALIKKRALPNIFAICWRMGTAIGTALVQVAGEFPIMPKIAITVPKLDSATPRRQP